MYLLNRAYSRHAHKYAYVQVSNKIQINFKCLLIGLFNLKY
jgi:hypothetical protein